MGHVDNLRGLTCIKSLSSLRSLAGPTNVDISCSDVADLLCHSRLAEHVVQLNAHMCKLCSVDGLHLFVNLVKLDLSNNKLTEFRPDYMSLPSLTHLNLAGNRLGSRLSLMAFPNLEYLDISNTELDGLSLSFPKSLKTLICENNNISDLCEVALLRRLTNLEELSLLGNPCLDKLSASESSITVKALIFAALKNVNRVVLDADALLRAESLQMTGIGKFKPMSGQHQKLVNFVLQKSASYQPPKSHSDFTHLTRSAPPCRTHPKLSLYNTATSIRMPNRTDIDSGRADSIQSDAEKTPVAKRQLRFESRPLVKPQGIVRSPYCEEQPTPDTSLDMSNLGKELSFAEEESFCSTKTVTISRTDDSTGQQIFAEFTPRKSGDNPSPFIRPNVSKCLAQRNRKLCLKLAKFRQVSRTRQVKREENWQRERIQMMECVDQLAAQVQYLTLETNNMKKHMDYMDSQFEVIPTDIRLKPLSENKFLMEWKNVPKHVLDVERHELEVNDEIFTVKGNHQKAVITDPRDCERISIRTVQKTTGRKCTPTEVVFYRDQFKDLEKENWRR